MAATVTEFLERDPVEERRDRIVLLDIWLGDKSPLETNVQRLTDEGYGIVLYTAEERPGLLQSALRTGAAGVVSKNDNEAELEDAIRAAVRGDKEYLSPLMAAIVLSDESMVPRLTPRQREVFLLYVSGLSRRQVARELECSENTVATHLKEVKARYQALGQSLVTRTDLLNAAQRGGFTDVNWYRPR